MEAAGFPFNTEYRARPLKVIDGDTIDLLVDQGFHSYRVERFRLLGINTPEMRSSELEVRNRAEAARRFVIDRLETAIIGNPASDMIGWTVRIRTEKADSFGRWLCNLWYWHEGTQRNLSQDLLDAGHAVVYKR